MLAVTRVAAAISGRYYVLQSTLTTLGSRAHNALATDAKANFLLENSLDRQHTVTTISGIAILARRWGADWKDFRPEVGVLLAERDGWLMTSATINDQLVVFIIQLLDRKDDRQHRYIQTAEADGMFFGILPGYNPLDVPSYRVGSLAEALGTMYIL